MTLYFRFCVFVYRLRIAWLAFRASGVNPSGVSYGALTRHGVPHATVVIGIGRDAWRVSDFALNAYAERWEA